MFSFDAWPVMSAWHAVQWNRTAFSFDAWPGMSAWHAVQRNRTAFVELQGGCPLQPCTYPFLRLGFHLFWLFLTAVEVSHGREKQQAASLSVQAAK
jgi:hypothetical protein